jgi:hypothetical protein
MRATHTFNSHFPPYIFPVSVVRELYLELHVVHYWKKAIGTPVGNVPKILEVMNL